MTAKAIHSEIVIAFAIDCRSATETVTRIDSPIVTATETLSATGSACVLS